MNAATIPVPMKLLTMCCECGLVWEVPFDGSTIDTGRLYREEGWVLSIVSKEPRVLMAFLCKECVPKHYPPEMIEALKARWAEGIVN